MSKRSDARPKGDVLKWKDNAKQPPKPDGFEYVSAGTILSYDVHNFCEAVTQPFSRSARGAVLPDQYLEAAVPCLDTHDVELAPAAFNYNGDWTASGDAGSGVRFRLVGCLIWLQPRCVSANVIHTQSLHGLDIEEKSSTVKYPSVCRSDSSDNGNMAHSDDIDSLAELYTLCYTGSWSVEVYNNGRTTSSTKSTGLYSAALGPVKTDSLFPGYRTVPFPRLGNIAVNSTGARILGMGLKVWSNGSKTVKGEVATAGWLSLHQVLDAACDSSGRTMHDIGASFRGSVQRHGGQGVTARYSPLQDSKQLVHQPCFLDKKLYHPSLIDGFENSSSHRATDVSSGSPIGWGREYAVAGVQDVADLRLFDAIEPGSFVPVCYWRFSNEYRALIDDTNLIDGVHTVALEAVVHVEAIPNGACPFLGGPVDKFNGVDQVKDFLVDWRYFPPATNGHSFTSFAKRARNVRIRVHRGLGHLHKVGALLGHMADKASAGSKKRAGR
jgi:hypothetical protein